MNIPISSRLLRFPAFAFVLMMLCCVGSSQLYAQSFAPILDSSVHAIALQADGKIVIGGAFTQVNGQGRNRIARLNADGTLDVSFNPGSGTDYGVESIALQTDGKIVIGGSFSQVNGVSRNYIARLSSDGSLDTSFNPGSGANDDVRSVAVQPDGKIVIGGWFVLVDGTTRNLVARLNTDGSLDTTFDPGSGANSNVNQVAVQSNGKIIVAGYFSSFGGASRNGIARVNSDGTLDTTFDPGSGMNYAVRTVGIQSDDKIVVGGNFTVVNGAAHDYVARLNSDGTLDSTFTPGTNNQVACLLLQTNGKIVIGGGFTQVNGVGRDSIARLNSDGTLDTSFDSGSGPNFPGVEHMVIQSDGKLIIAGPFTFVSGVLRNYIARLSSIGSLDGVGGPSAGGTQTGGGQLTDGGGCAGRTGGPAFLALLIVLMALLLYRIGSRTGEVAWTTRTTRFKPRKPLKDK